MFIEVNWLMESDLFSENLTRLSQEIIKQGHNVTVLSDDRAHRWTGSYTTAFPADACVVFYGSIELCADLIRKTPWVPGAFCTMKNYNCTSYYPHFGKYLLNGDYSMLPFGELRRQKELLYDTFGEDNAVFIRPNAGNKIFTGQLVYQERFDKDIELMGFYETPDSELCVVSSPVNMRGEYRFVVVDRKIITGSQYRDNDGNLIASPVPCNPELYPQDIVDSVQWQPDRVWVLDMCHTAGGRYSMLEINSFSCSGLYGCDMEPIVREVSRVAQEEYKDVT